MKHLLLPMMTTHGEVVLLRIEEHEHGDPLSFTIRVPEECNGVVSLSRNMFSSDLLAQFDASEP